jgi:hypothetical protein
MNVPTWAEDIGSWDEQQNAGVVKAAAAVAP